MKLSRVLSSHPLTRAKLLRNIHLWIILLLTASIIIFYYNWQNWFPDFWYYFVFVEYIHSAIGLIVIAVPFVYATIAFHWRGAAIIGLISVPALIPLLLRYYAPTSNKFPLNITFLALPAVVIVLVAFERNWRRTEKQIAREREKERQIYMAQLIAAQEAERRRLSLELHDDAIQRLIALANYADNSAMDLNQKPPEAVKQDFLWIRDNTADLTEDLRRMSMDLRPSILDNFGLIPALRWLVGRLHRETEITAKVKIEGEIRTLSPKVEDAIFRIVQEALTNAKKHANCNTVLVSLEFNQDSLQITMEDNGKGFVKPEGFPMASEGKLGLIGMEQRARSIDAALDIQSHPGKGTMITLSIGRQSLPI
ncbi:MAG: sensor histidine kinase [Dehalococcoidales bacterium]|nr:sensor histidine kinase [Dehalococcoidales bacterium]